MPSFIAPFPTALAEKAMAKTFDYHLALEEATAAMRMTGEH